LPYHPDNPASYELQRLWRTLVFHPPGEAPLNSLTNREGEPTPIDQMVIAYSRAPNLGNMLSYRKICKRLGPKVSSYLWLDIIRPLLFFKLQHALPTAGLLCSLKNKLCYIFVTNCYSWNTSQP
jgi:hypothetical protein